MSTTDCVILLCGFNESLSNALVCFPCATAVAAARDGKSLVDAVTAFTFCCAALVCPSSAFPCFAHVGRRSVVCVVVDPLLVILVLTAVALPDTLDADFDT